MKALVYKGPETLAYEDAADPAPMDGAPVISVESVGICGSDMHAYLGHDERRPAPLILGHEVAGLRGDSGARVTINPLVTCGTCRYCREGRDNLCTTRQIISMPPREGGFAEMVSLPERNLVPVPDHVTPDQAALAEPIACGWHAVRMARAAGAAGPALVIGGGAIGVGAALSLKAQGIADVTLVEPNAVRSAYLKDRAEFEVTTPDAVPADGRFNIVIDGVGIEPTRAQASALVAPGGVIVHIGLGSSAGGLDIRRMTLQEISFIGTYTYTAQDFRDTAAAMFDGRLGILDWVETRPLSDGARAFADIRSGAVAAPKIILKP
ncbi:alcohol dehydrogenase catalytic domain-containing protein [Ovoidimarina sediminis]|uniref:alcohol dehydrogenase catalytic domain-containing protein n=1 Tax=Ovoidimarina sediminis TaxID=3079856 RepID=UPI00291292C6|nr:alcohol dehydrogenase catalytic domain-containing protein [Rhodophyticola sp. MJ-SS7]MDU8946041.1 alcohol dehydrogenase catalytic domain-containing protein [Rhodophyticola sp. MJ-SS7]